MRKGDSHAQRLGSVESGATSKRRLHAQRVRTGRDSRLPGKVNTKRRDQKTRQRMMLQMTKLKRAGVPAGRKGGGSVGMWKPR